MIIVANILLAWVAAAIGGVVGWYLRGRHEQRRLPPATARQLKRAARANRADMRAMRITRDDFDSEGKTRP